MNSREMRLRWYRAVGPGRKRRSWPELLVVAVTVALYARTLSFGLVFDDHSLIGQDGPNALGGEWLPYRPLRWASLWLDHWAGGGAFWVYHATNVALHAAAGVLLVRLARRAGASGLIVAACALLFSVHPLAVESVAYVAGRRDLLAAVLGLGALLAWSSPRGATSTAILLAVASVAAKESGALFIGLLGVASACGIGPRLRTAAVPLACAVVAAAALPVAYGAVGPVASRGPLATKLVIAGTLAEHYVHNLVAPGRLSAEYPHLRCEHEDCTSLGRGRAAVGLTVLAGLGLCAASLASRGRKDGARAVRDRGGNERAWTVFAAVWLTLWLAALAFVIGAHEPGADRHAYLAPAALALLAAAVAARSSPSARLWLGGALCLWVVALAARTQARIPAWSNDFSLWSSALRAGMSSARIHHNLAAALAEEGSDPAARRHLRRALEIEPDYWPSDLALAALACERGRFHAAAARLERVPLHSADPSAVASVERRCERRRKRR